MCSHWSLRTKAWSSEDWLPGPQREMWQMPGQQVPCPRTTGACPHARCCSNTDGLPRSHPHQFQGLCSFCRSTPLPFRSTGHHPSAFLALHPLGVRNTARPRAQAPALSHRCARPSLPTPTSQQARGPGLIPLPFSLPLLEAKPSLWSSQGSTCRADPPLPAMFETVLLAHPL